MGATRAGRSKTAEKKIDRDHPALQSAAVMLITVHGRMAFCSSSLVRLKRFVLG